MRAALILATVLFAAAAWAQEPVSVSGPTSGPDPGPEALERLLESGQWTLEAKTVLAQSLWGEAGICPNITTTFRGRVVACDHEGGPGALPNTDWRLIPWVLLSRWDTLRSTGITFVDLIRAYSSPVRPALASDEILATARASGDQGLVSRILRRRALQSRRFDGSNVPPQYLSRWLQITAVVESWGQGEIPNPCPAARHWDRRGVFPRNMTQVCEGIPTLNAFWTVRRYN